MNQALQYQPEKPSIGRRSRNVMPRACNCHEVHATFQGRHGLPNVTVEVLRVPEICTVKGPLMGNDLLCSLPSQKIFAADASTTNFASDAAINFLVELNIYWLVVAGWIKRLETVPSGVVQGKSSSKLFPGSTIYTAVLPLVGGDHIDNDNNLDLTKMWQLDLMEIMVVGIQITTSKVGSAGDFKAAVQLEGRAIYCATLDQVSCSHVGHHPRGLQNCA